MNLAIQCLHGEIVKLVCKSSEYDHIEKSSHRTRTPKPKRTHQKAEALHFCLSVVVVTVVTAILLRLRGLQALKSQTSGNEQERPLKIHLFKHGPTHQAPACTALGPRSLLSTITVFDNDTRCQQCNLGKTKQINKTSPLNRN